jgi:preprotein translocase subunit SecG
MHLVTREAIEGKMRKSTICLFVLLIVGSLSLGFVHQVSSQPENIGIVNYSWYVDSYGYFVIVGEAQNVGPNTIESVVLGGEVYTNEGELLATSNPTFVYVNCLVPQQKAPFYIEFSPPGGDQSWWTAAVDHVDFKILSANVTGNYRYPYVTVESSSGAADAEGVYWVSGTVKNSGSQTATNIRVIGTFYNASGTVVAVGYTEYLTPASLSPSSVASFKVGAFDRNETLVPSAQKIASYSLLVQVKEPLLTGTAPPPDSSNSTTTPSDTSNSSSSSPSDTVAPDTQLVAVIVIVVLGLAGVILVLNRRKSHTKSLPKPEATKNHKPKARKKRK